MAAAQKKRQEQMSENKENWRKIKFHKIDFYEQD
jgi:hypothetical protein